MSANSLSAVSRRFRAIHLHDSMLCGISMEMDCDGKRNHPPIVSISLNLRLFRGEPPDYWFEPAEMEFQDCT